jgi:probable rRNA maturation factor
MISRLKDRRKRLQAEDRATVMKEAADDVRATECTVELSENSGDSPVPLSLLNALAQRACDITGSRGGEISLVVCDDGFIAALNREYRGKNCPTDVLSFPMMETTVSDERNHILGDIVVSVQTAAVQARDLGNTLQEEFAFLFIHGMLHLLGYTHSQRQDEKIMMDTAHEILSGIKGNP